MPRVEFSEENKVATTSYDFPRLKLKVGERARVMAGLESPVMEYVHTLRAPVIENGRPVITQVERRGKMVDEYKMDFISRPLCLGDAATLKAKGSDPKNCPICKLAQESPDKAKAPEARYAMHVIRYRTKGGTFDVQAPFSVELLVWTFNQKVFNKIFDIKNEFGSLQKNDLTLGPCVAPEYFQNFDIQPGAKAEWLAAPDRKDLVIQTFKENQIPDLTVAVGRVTERKWIEDDIENKVNAAWAQVHGAPSSAEGSVSLDEDLNNLVGGADEVWADGKTEAEVTTPGVDDVDPFADLALSTADAESDAGGTEDFEDLLAGLKE